MTNRLATIYLSAVFLLVLTSPSAQAQNPNANLKGISAVGVLIEELPDGAKVLGLSEGMIKTDVELKLRLAGMLVTKMEDALNLPGSPYLYVNLSLTSGAEAAHVSVQLRQDATLARNRQSAFGVTTWDIGTVVSHPTAQGIRNYIKDDCDQFLNDWLSVNPKK
jgi:hypothetical protein